MRITLSDYKVRLMAAKTKVGYQTNQFFSVLTRACQRAKEIIQAKKTPDPNGALSTEQFIENTGVDDILSSQYHHFKWWFDNAPIRGQYLQHLKGGAESLPLAASR